MNDMTYARDLPDLYADVAAVPGGVDAFAVVSNNLPGKPLVYNGQETGLDHRLDDGVRVTTQPDFAESAHRRFYAHVAAPVPGERSTVPRPVHGATDSLGLGGFEGRYTDVFTGARTRIKSTLKRQLEPWGYQVLRRTG